MRVGAAGQLGVGSVGAAGGLDRMRVGPAGGTGAGSSRCGWEDWGWCRLVQLGDWDDVGECGWGTRMVSIGAAGEGR